MKQVTNERDYFQVTLGLREKFDFGVLLEKSSIVPSDSKSYELAAIISGIKLALKFSPLVSCYLDEESNKQYLAEMQVCLSKDLTLIDCSMNDKHSSVPTMLRATEQACSSKMPIYYPVLAKNYL